MDIAVPIKFGNATGRHFAQWRWNLCIQLAEELAKRGATELYVWYDAPQDFHHCDCSLYGSLVQVELYEHFTARTNGHEWRSSQYEIFDLSRQIENLIKKERGTNIYHQPVDVNPERLGLSPL